MPPSAWITSQSTVIWRSPSACRSTTARSERPISRWISCVRPPCLPAAASRRMRSPVERGSMPYSAVTQPLPELRSQAGAFSSRLAVHSTWVSPNFTRQEPSACLETPRSKETSRIWSVLRLEGRIRLLSCRFQDSWPACSRTRREAQRKMDQLRGRGRCLFRLGRTYIARNDQGSRSRFPVGGSARIAALRSTALQSLDVRSRDIFRRIVEFLSEGRRAARLAQPVASPADVAFAGLRAQRDERSRGSRPDLLAAYLRRPTADPGRPALLRRCLHGGRRSLRRGAPHRSTAGARLRLVVRRWSTCSPRRARCCPACRAAPAS